MLSTNLKRQLFEVSILIIIFITSILLWDSAIIYPIKLITVLLHEISHGIAAILTGGQIIELDIAMDLSGFAKIEGGNSFIIAFSGYVGSFFFGMLIFYSAYKKNFRNIFLPIISILIIIFLINSSKNINLILIAIGIIILLFLINHFLPHFIFDLILKIQGLVSCTYVIIDIKHDVMESSTTFSDASVLAEMTGISQITWGIIWLLILAVGFFILFRLTFKQRFKN